MYCPECGHDAGDAKFCPECGADLARIRGTLSNQPSGRRTGNQGRRGGADRGGAGRQNAGGRSGGGQSAAGRSGAAGGEGAGRRSGPRPKGSARRTASAAPARPARRGLSPALIWGVCGAVAVIVVVAVIAYSGGFGSAGPSATASSSATPVPGVVTGSYGTLVQDANNFYNQGDAQFTKKNYSQGAAYFQAAATTYAAAWKLQSSDPSVGTDYATSLFYAGHTDAAIQQARAVIKKSPNFQAVYLNLGIYLASKASDAQQSGGSSASVKSTYSEARQAFTKAVSLNPGSTEGTQAATSLKSLPQ